MHRRIVTSAASDAVSDVPKNIDIGRSDFEKFTETLTTLFPVWVRCCFDMCSPA